MPEDKQIYKRRGTVALGMFVTGAMAVVALVLSCLTIPDHTVSAWEKVTTSTFLLPAIWFAWRVAVRPRVELRASGLTVVNFLFTYTIPCGALERVSTVNGLTFTAAGEEISVLAFSGSFLAGWLGDSRRRELVEQVSRRMAEQPQAGEGGPVPRTTDISTIDVLLCVMPVLNFLLAALLT